MADSDSGHSSDEDYSSANVDDQSHYQSARSRLTSMDMNLPFQLDLDVQDDREGSYAHRYVPHLMTDVSQRRAVGVFEKVLVQKKTFNINMKIDAEVDQVTKCWCGPFNPEQPEAIRYIYPTILKTEFQKIPEMIFDSDMVSSTIIGWTTENNETFYLNQTQLGDLADDPIPVSDSLFPVLVMGWNDYPVLPEVFEEQNSLYRAGLYLILWDKPFINEFEIWVSVYKRNSMMKFFANTYKGCVELVLLQDNWDPTTNQFQRSYRSWGTVNRILDRENPDFFCYGMYAGGPLIDATIIDHFRYRITWDQPIKQSEDFGFSAMNSLFRYELDYQRYARRVGYLCGKDALMFTKEVRKWYKNESKDSKQKYNNFFYNSLLKQHTYVIVDGTNVYEMWYTIDSATKSVTFKDKVSNNPLGPTIVVATEGVSYLLVREHHRTKNYRSAKYYNTNPGVPPICMDWIQFQNDFGEYRAPEDTGDQFQQFMTHRQEVWREELDTEPEPEPDTGVEFIPRQPQPAQAAHRFTPDSEEIRRTGFDQIMSLDDINDIIFFNFVSIHRVYVFSLKSRPNYYPQTHEYLEHWNVFCLLRPQDMSEAVDEKLCYYLATITNIHGPNPYTPNRALEYKKTRFHKSFPAPIDRRRFPTITEDEHRLALQMAEEFKNIMSNREWRNYVGKIFLIKQDQILNQGVNTAALVRQKSRLEFTALSSWHKSRHTPNR